MSAAKGLAWAKALPCCGVSTLEAMAYGVTDFEGIVVGAMDARRQQVYNALFRTENGRVTRLCADRAVAMELVAEELAAIPEPKLIVGDGAVLLYDFLQKAGIGCRLASPAPAAERRGRGAGGGASCRAGADVFRPGIAAGVSAAEPGGARTAGQGAVPDSGVKRIPLKFHIHGG